MSDPQIVVTLRGKRADLKRQIEALERQLSETRVALGHVSAVIHLYEVGSEAAHEYPAHLDLSRIVPRGTLWKMAKAALEARGRPMTTPEIAAYVMAEKGWNPEDRPLRKAITYRLVQSLTMQWKRGAVISAGKVKNARAWSF